MSTPEYPSPSPSSLEDRLEAERLAIDNCESIPIRTIDNIQPVGFLLATDARFEEITHVSENVSQLVGPTASQLLGTAPTALLGSEIVHEIRNIAGHSTIRSQREYVTSATIRDVDNPFDISIYAANHRLIAECQPHSDKRNPAKTVSETKRILTLLSETESVDELLELAVDHLRHFAGYDRVKAYRFLPDGAGEIAAESRSATVDSFLGLRFPAFDIPESARALYAKTPIRVISSVDAPGSPIISLNEFDEPLDLGLAVLRGCVPVHTQYLQNMGVRATLSLPIVVGGEMWGLLAFHHHQDRAPDGMTTMSLELLGRSISMMIENHLERDDADRRRSATALASSFLVIDDSSEGFATHWHSAKNDLSELIKCDGVALVGRLDALSAGTCPPSEVIRETVNTIITSRSQEGEDRTPVALTSLATEFPTIGELDGGALVLCKPIPFVDAIVFFRDPLRKQIRWAGQTTKDIEEVEAGVRLVPRASFEEYLESVDGHCEDWSVQDIQMANALQLAFHRAQSTSELQVAHRDRLGLMVRELNHRVRNILALVSSLMRQSETGATTVEDYVSALGDRISALAGAHDLLTQNEWRPIQLVDLVAQSLKPYLSDSPPRINISGPAFAVTPDAAHMLVLVLHELASNAAKYGALSVPNGQVALAWELRTEELRITWQESNGPPVLSEPAEGLGASIIRNALVFEFNAQSSLEFKPSGVTAEFVLPWTVITLADSSEVPTTDLRERVGSMTEPLQVLIVEDDFLIARETASSITRFGLPKPQQVATVTAALQAISNNHFDLVLLDANLNGEFSGPVATELGNLNIPFVFITGYGSQDQELQPFAQRRILTKPLREDRLRQVVAEVAQEKASL